MSAAVRAMRARGYDAWRAGWMGISRSPRWFPALVRVQRRDLEPCGPHHDLVIDGFPRSGNTFATHAFLSVNPQARVSHHMHTPANVLRALEFGVPALVLIRPPADAVLSEVIREPRKSVPRGLQEWLSFYETVRPYLDRVTVAPFSAVTSAYDKTLTVLNERSGTAFAIYVNSPATDAAVLAGIDERARARGKAGERLERQVPRPSVSRAVHKREMVTHFDEPRTRVLLERAVALHAEYLDAAG